MHIPQELVDEILLNLPIDKAIPTASDYIIKKMYDPKIHTWMFAIKHGYVNLVKYLWSLDMPILYSYENNMFRHDQRFPLNDIIRSCKDNDSLFFLLCAHFGHMNLVTWFRSWGKSIPSTAMHVACGRGHLELVKFFYTQNISLDSCSMRYAILGNHLDILKYAVNMKFSSPEWICWDFCREDADFPSVDVFNYFVQHPTISFLTKSTLMFAASSYEKIPIILSLISHDIPCDKLHMNIACHSGHKKLVSFFHSIGIETTAFSMDTAISNGHLDVVKMLYSYGQGCASSSVKRIYEDPKGKKAIVNYLKRKKASTVTGLPSKKIFISKRAK